MQLHVFPLCGRRERFTTTFSSFSFITSASVASMSVGSQPRSQCPLEEERTWELGNEVGRLLVWILFVIHRHICSTTVYVMSENWNIQVPRAFNALTTDAKLDRYRVTIVNEIHNICHKRFRSVNIFSLTTLSRFSFQSLLKSFSKKGLASERTCLWALKSISYLTTKVTSND